MPDSPTVPIRVSVVIPAYNAAGFIGRALESVRAQSVAPIETIVVDDGSTDGTAEVVERGWPSVRVLRQANAGPGAARNHGVREAAGDWIGLLDADDAWLPEKLEKQLPLTAGERVGLVHATRQTADAVPDTVGFDRLWERNCIANSSALVRRAAWCEVGDCDEDRALISVEDYNLWLRMAAAGWEIVTCRHDLIRYICEAGHLTSRHESYARAEIANIASVAARLGLDAATVEAKRLRTLDEQGRLLLYHRRVAPARNYLLQPLRRRPTAVRLGSCRCACLPRPLLELRRSARQRAMARP